jgi:hypothetical protein
MCPSSRDDLNTNSQSAIKGMARRTFIVGPPSATVFAPVFAIRKNQTMPFEIYPFPAQSDELAPPAAR